MLKQVWDNFFAIFRKNLVENYINSSSCLYDGKCFSQISWLIPSHFPFHWSCTMVSMFTQIPEITPNLFP